MSEDTDRRFTAEAAHAERPRPGRAVRPPRRWPLALLALPAFVAVWAGWVELGAMTGFGVVRPLPGILDDLVINTAVTLPVGVEAYAAYAMSAWLTTTRAVSAGTRRFAKWSALGSLLLGAGGQVAYHLMRAAGYTVAPWWITAVVACIPVGMVGMAAGLMHMLHRDAAEALAGTAGAVEGAPVDAPGTAQPGRTEGTEGEVRPGREGTAVAPAVPAPAAVEAPAPAPVETPSGTAERPAEGGPSGRYGDADSGDGGDEDAQVSRVPAALEGVPVDEDLKLRAAQRFFTSLIAGKVPPVRQIKAELNIATDRARAVRAYLDGIAAR